MNATLEATTTEYLSEIKFRNAVKRATSLKVRNKNSFEHYAITIDLFRNEWFTVRFVGGGYIHPVSAQLQAEKQLMLTHHLYAAGFEHSYMEARNYLGETVLESVWRKAGN
jgi:hypothetical protein